MSQILTLHWILEGVHAKNLEATIFFLDFTKAFDSIHRGKMKQILLAYGLLKETIVAIMMLYRNMKVKVHSSDGNTDYFDIIGVLQGDTLAPYLFIICLDYVLGKSINKIKDNKRKKLKVPHKNNYRCWLRRWHSASDISTRLAKAWTGIDRPSVTWKSDLADEIERSFFQAAVVSTLLYGCTTWTLTHGENAWLQLHKNAVSNIEQVPEAAPNEASAVRPPTIHHENYQN